MAGQADDGVPYVSLVDTTGDGRLNAVRYSNPQADVSIDVEQQGMPIDTTGDGKNDALGFDTTNDGHLDSVYKLPDGWEAQTDELGKIFYFHDPSGTTHSQPPASDDSNTGLMSRISSGLRRTLSQRRRDAPPPQPGPLPHHMIDRRGALATLQKVMLENPLLTFLSLIIYVGWIYIWVSNGFRAPDFQRMSGSRSNCVSDDYGRIHCPGDSATGSKNGDSNGGGHLGLIGACFPLAHIFYFGFFIFFEGLFPPGACLCCDFAPGPCLENSPRAAFHEDTIGVDNVLSYTENLVRGTAAIELQVKCSHTESRTTGSGKNRRTSNVTVTTFTDQKIFPTTACRDASDDPAAFRAALDSDVGNLYRMDFSYNFALETPEMQQKLEQARQEYYRQHQHRDRSTEVTAVLKIPKRGPQLMRKDHTSLTHILVLNICTFCLAAYCFLLLPYLCLYNILAVPANFKFKKVFRAEM